MTRIPNSSVTCLHLPSCTFQISNLSPTAQKWWFEELVWAQICNWYWPNEKRTMFIKLNVPIRQHSIVMGKAHFHLFSTFPLSANYFKANFETIIKFLLIIKIKFRRLLFFVIMKMYLTALLPLGQSIFSLCWFPKNKSFPLLKSHFLFYPV